MLEAVSGGRLLGCLASEECVGGWMGGPAGECACWEMEGGGDTCCLGGGLASWLMASCHTCNSVGLWRPAVTPATPPSPPLLLASSRWRWAWDGLVLVVD